MDLETYSKTLKELRDRETTLDKELKAIREKIEMLQPEFVAYMQDHRLQNAHVAGIGTVFLQNRNYAKIKDQIILFEALRKSGNGNLIKETIHPSTLRGYANDTLKENKPLPPGMEVYTKTVVAIRKEK